MVIQTKTLKNSFSMPIFGLGTWKMGGAFQRDPHNDDMADMTAIRAAIEMAITHIDTAEAYADGHAEELVGRAIKDFPREKLFLVSKVRRENLRYDDVIWALHNSLKRLQTDYLDLYLIHGPNTEIPLKETMLAMSKLHEEKLIRNVGVSNFSVQRYEEAQTYTRCKIVANQVHYNLRFREPERKGLVEYCQTHDVMLIAWRPIQFGTLAEKAYPVVDELCQKYQKTPVQIAINWLVSQPNVVTLSKMRSREHLVEDLGALGWCMDSNDIERLRREFPNQEDVSDTVPLG